MSGKYIEFDVDYYLKPFVGLKRITYLKKELDNIRHIFSEDLGRFGETVLKFIDSDFANKKLEIIWMEAIEEFFSEEEYVDHDFILPIYGPAFYDLFLDIYKKRKNIYQFFDKKKLQLAAAPYNRLFSKYKKINFEVRLLKKRQTFV
ncbi:MAG: hypothetical protein WCG05_03415 [Alphaproteobacteria bacterium]